MGRSLQVLEHGSPNPAGHVELEGVCLRIDIFVSGTLAGDGWLVTWEERNAFPDRNHALSLLRAFNRFNRWKESLASASTRATTYGARGVRLEVAGKIISAYLLDATINATAPRGTGTGPGPGSPPIETPSFGLAANCSEKP